jgi:hypothetical protein
MGNTRSARRLPAAIRTRCPSAKRLSQGCVAGVNSGRKQLPGFRESRRAGASSSLLAKGRYLYPLPWRRAHSIVSRVAPRPQAARTRARAPPRAGSPWRGAFLRSGRECFRRRSNGVGACATARKAQARSRAASSPRSRAPGTLQSVQLASRESSMGNDHERTNRSPRGARPARPKSITRQFASLATPAGFEPATCRLEGGCSIH